MNDKIQPSNIHPLHSDKAETQRCEALVLLTALNLMESHSLIGPKQLEQIREEMEAVLDHTLQLHKGLTHLIDVLQTHQTLHRGSARTKSLLDQVDRSISHLDREMSELKSWVDRARPSAEDYQRLMGPLFRFCQQFTSQISRFQARFRLYLEAKEDEAWCSEGFHQAQKQRQVLRNKLITRLDLDSGGPPAGRPFSRRNELDYVEWEARLQSAHRVSRHQTEQLNHTLDEIQHLCDMVTHPSLREKGFRTLRQPVLADDDLHAILARAAETSEFVAANKARFLEFFRLLQQAHPSFLDYYYEMDKAIATIIGECSSYFQEKAETGHIENMASRLHKVEKLIPFLRAAEDLIRRQPALPTDKFSLALSRIISQADAPWSSLAESLLDSKLQAEANLG